MRRLALLVFCLVGPPAAAQTAVAQTAAPPPKQTAMVAMRDGVQLATDIYLPAAQGRFPVLLARTPYNKDGMGDAGRSGALRGYAVVIQDTRGRFASKGANLPFETDGWWGPARDGYDTVEWIARQLWYGGKLGTFGGSALGITQLTLAGTGTPRLTAQSIVVAAPRPYFGLCYNGGAFREALAEDWLRAAAFDARALATWTAHSTYDAYWQERDLSTRWAKVDAPAVHTGGWYDIFAQGTLDAFTGYQTRGGPNARGKQKLLMGPWTHGVMQPRAGDLTFPNGAAPPGSVADPWAWCDHYLKGAANGWQDVPVVTYYVMGDTSDPSAPGNQWRTAGRWPPFATTATAYYLHADRSLSTHRPTAAKASLTYASDPADPVPTVGGPQLTLPAGPRDQRPIEARPDILVFTSDTLRQPIEITGKVEAKLWVSSDAPDTDFVARLCDVYPDGRSINVCEGILRARFRDGFSKERLLTPGTPVALTVDLWSTSIIVNRGHRLRVHVASSSSRAYDVNPNTGERLRSSTRTRVAHNTVLMESSRASSVVLPMR